MSEVKINTNESMRLGKTEFLMMNNPIRRFIQKYVELGWFKRVVKQSGLNLNGKTILDAGCGSGYSTYLLNKAFAPGEIFTFDLMPEQIEIAKKKFREFNFQIGDMNQINLSDEKVDAIFIFGVLHHVPEKNSAIKELKRVLKPGGYLLIEEPRYHFTWTEFENYFLSAGFSLINQGTVYTNYYRGYLFQKNS